MKNLPVLLYQLRTLLLFLFWVYAYILLPHIAFVFHSAWSHLYFPTKALISFSTFLCTIEWIQFPLFLLFLFWRAGRSLDFFQRITWSHNANSESIKWTLIAISGFLLHIGLTIGALFLSRP